MKFPYREYICGYSGTTDLRIARRPVIPIRVVGQSTFMRCNALVDTGADETLFPSAIARALGVEFETGVTSEALGFTGDGVSIRFGRVTIEIESDGETVAWTDTVGFADFPESDDLMVILGHGGCLDYFLAVFDGERGELELTPNAFFADVIADDI